MISFSFCSFNLLRGKTTWWLLNWPWSEQKERLEALFLSKQLGDEHFKWTNRLSVMLWRVTFFNRSRFEADRGNPESNRRNRSARGRLRYRDCKNTPGIKISGIGSGIVIPGRVGSGIGPYLWIKKMWMLKLPSCKDGISCFEHLDGNLWLLILFHTILGHDHNASNNHLICALERRYLRLENGK